MAKLAVLFFAALAFQAAFAGVFNRLSTQPLDYQVGQTGDLEYGLKEYVGQIHAVANQWSLALQNVHPTSKTFVWQSRELAQLVEEIYDRLQVETGKHSSEIDTVLQQVLSQLREIQASLQQFAGNSDISGVSQIKEQLATYVQVLAKIFEKLIYLAQVNPVESQGSLYYTIKIAVSEFLTAFRHIQTQVPYVSYAAEYEHSPMQWAYYGLKGDDLYHQEGLYNPVAYKAGKYGLGYQYGIFGQSGFKYGQSTGLAMQIQSVASDLSAALRYVYADNTLVRQTLITLIREYVQNLEIIVERLEQVSYTTGTTTYTPQQVAQELKRYVLSLQQLVSSGVSMNAVELRNQLCLYVQQIASDLEKLTYGVPSGMKFIESRDTTYTVVKGVLVQFLTATRNLQIQVQNIAQVGQRGQTVTGFGMQIQTLANGLTSALESVSVDNVYVRQVLVQQSREFAQYLETIIEKLQSVTYSSVYGADLPRQVAANLRQIVVALQQFSEVENVAFAYKLKMHLIAYIQEAATEIQKLLWVGQNYQQGQGEFFNTALYGIFNDFAAALQRFQVQFYGMYQTGQYSQYGFGSPQLALQIQAITNNLAIYFHNVPTSGVQVRQQVEFQARRLAHNIQSIIERLEVEAVHTTEIAVIQKVVAHLRQIVATLEQVTVYESTATSYEVFTRFYTVLQKVAADMKKLAFVAQYNVQEVQGNVNSVVRSVLIQYLVVLQHVQMQFQGYGQTVLVGQTPRELALQIQVVAHRLTGMLRVVPDNRQSQIYLVYQARRFSYIIDVIVHKLQAELTTGTGNYYYVARQVAANLKQIQLALQQAVTSVEVVSAYQLKMQLAARIQDAAIEIQKLMFVGQYDIQQVQGTQFAFIRGALVDFLSGLQHLQLQIQDNLQIVYNGQSPRTLVMQIQSIASRLSAYLQYAQSNSQQLRQIFIIQIGEFAQTVENVIYMLHAEIKNNGENNVTFKQVAEQLTTISLALQRVTDVESKIPVPELSAQFVLNIQRFISEIEKLAYISQYKVQQTFVGTYHTGVVNGVFNNVLATFRNIFIQFQNFQQFGQYGHSTQELSNQIQTISNHLAQSFQLVGATNKQVKQALAIQSLKFARRVQYIVERLESEVSYNSAINVNALQQIVQNLKQVVSTLQQVGGIWTTATVADLRAQINTQVQAATAQFQKMLVAQTTLQQTQGYVSTIVKSVLIEYLAIIQNLHLRVQTIAQVSQKGQSLYQLAIQIETAAFELSTSFQHIRPTNKLVGQIIPVEARRFAQVIATIISKLHSVTGVESNGIVAQVAIQLKQIQFALQQFAGVETTGSVYQQKMYLELYVRRAAILIQQLVWAIQPEIKQVEITGFETIVRDILFEFWGAIQNVHVQIQNVVQNGQTYQSVWGLDLLGQGKYQGQYYGVWDLQRDYQGQHYPGLGYQGDYQGEYQGQHYAGLGLEREGEYQGQYYRGLGYQGDYQGDYQGQYYGGLGLEREGEYQGQYYRGLGYQGDYQGQYYRGLGYEGDYQGEYQGQHYGGLYRPYAALQGLLSGYYGQYYGGYGMLRGQSPKQYLIQIQAIVSRLSVALQSSTFKGQEAKQIIAIQVRQFVQIIENIIDQLQAEIVKGSDSAVFQQVLIRLREVQQALKQIVGYNTFTTVYQLKSELENYIQIAAAQMEKLVYIIEQVPQGNWNVIIKNVLYNFLSGIQRMQMQFQGVAQYGQGLYGQGYGYGKLYGYAGLNQYGNEYGYAGLNQYDNEYKYAGLNQYGNGYGYSGLNKYDNDYKYAGLNQYGNEYGYAGLNQYDNEYKYAGLNQYGNEYGYAGLNQYDNEYKYAGLNQHGNEYGYAGLNQYDNEYKYAGLNQYGNEYGYAGLNQYDNEYKYAGLNQYGNEYGYAGPYHYDDEFGYAGQFRPFFGAYGYPGQLNQYGNEYGYAGQFSGYQGGLKYGFQGLPAKQLATRVQYIANQVAQGIQTVAVDNKQFRQVAIYQARQLIQVLDNIVDRLQAELVNGYGYTEVVEQVIRNLRQIQGELQQIVSSGVLSTIYQVRAQFANYIQNISAELYKLAMVGQSDVQIQGNFVYVIKSVLNQYWMYLRNVQYLVQGNTVGQSLYSAAGPQFEGYYQGTEQLVADNYMTVPKTYQSYVTVY